VFVAVSSIVRNRGVTGSWAITIRTGSGCAGGVEGGWVAGGVEGGGVVGGVEGGGVVGGVEGGGVVGGVEGGGVNFGAGVTVVLTPAERVEELVTFAAVVMYSTFTPGGTSRDLARVLVAVTARFCARIAFAAAVPVFDALPSTTILIVPPPDAAS